MRAQRKGQFLAMLKTLRIQNFKSFTDLKFGGLKRVNLITGKNNTGKTGLLEALLLVLDPHQSLQLLMTAFRNCGNLVDANENFWKWQFHNHDTSRPIVVEIGTGERWPYTVAVSLGGVQPGYHEVVSSAGVVISVPSNNLHRGKGWDTALYKPGVVPLANRPTDPQKDAVDYDRVVLKSGGEERLENLLRKVEPRLKSIRSIKPYGASLIYLDVGIAEKIPAVHLGQGFLRLLSIYSELIASGKKVLLIDEIENGLHYSVLPEIWRGLLHAAETENVQIFATTHSYECIRAAHHAFAETLDYNFAVHRLEDVKGDITVTTYDKETLETSLANNFETR